MTKAAPVMPPRLRRMLTTADVRRSFLRRLPRLISDYIEGGAEDEITVNRNLEAYRRTVFRPRVLVDTSRRSLAVEVCGQELAMPVMLAPTGLTGLAHPAGELGAMRAAHRMGTLPVVGSASTYSIEELAAASAGPLWFQLYPWRDRELIESLVQRAATSGYTALCVTVDVPISGARERDARNGFTIPLRITPRTVVDVGRHPGWLARLAFGKRITLANLTGLDVPRDAMTLAHHMNARLVNPANDWAELAWIRSLWKGPMLVKGILDPDDALRALDAGADGLVVSNHGGRQLDGTPASLDALAAVADAVAGRADIVVDGGIRRGTDVVKALAVGARACLIGRPYLYGLAAGGEAGVERVLEILRAEIDRTLALLGCADVRELNRDHVVLAGRE